ncbi:MAG: TatD family hydrolase [Candidatus Pacearchaeota archaeon]|jgi:TatD DNase family protein
MFIDIHCHLDLFKEEEIDSLVNSAKKAGVEIIVNNSTNNLIDNQVINYSNKYKQVKACLGSYPIDCLKLSEIEIKNQMDFIKKNKEKIIGIGEVGLDFVEIHEKDKQIENFRKFIKLAKELDKPIIVHSRKAEEKAIEILEEEKVKKVLMHCFSGNLKLVKRIIENKWYLSIPTNITFSEHFQKVVEISPIEQLFCETDSPFLHPIKGKRPNEPANVVESYKKIAEIKNLKLKQVEEQISKNYKNLF